jgi:hypothetical protein
MESTSLFDSASCPPFVSMSTMQLTRLAAGYGERLNGPQPLMATRLRALWLHKQQEKQLQREGVGEASTADAPIGGRGQRETWVGRYAALWSALLREYERHLTAAQV